MPIIGTVNPRAEIEVGDARVIVRGLSAKDVGELTQKHMAALSELFKKAQALAVDEDKSDEEVNSGIVGLVTEALKDAPDLIADVIALAADEPDARDDIMTWPAVVQVRLIQEIAALTFVSWSELENLVGALVQLMPGQASPESPGH